MIRKYTFVIFYFLRFTAAPLFCIAGCLFTSGLFAQQPTEEWVRRYNSPDNLNDNAIDMAIDKAGNIYIAGDNITTNEGNNIVVVKYNNAGVQQWAKSFNYSGSSNDFSSAIAVDTSGNVYIAGYTQFGTGQFDWLVIKYNDNGTFQWFKFYSNPYGGDDISGSLGIDTKQNVYVVGYEQYSQFNIGALLIKFNSSGDSINVIRYRPTPPLPPWGLRTAFSKVKIDEQNNFYIGGASNNSQTLNIDCFVFKYDSAGNQQWFTPYNSGGNRRDNLIDMCLDLNNNVYATGMTALQGGGSVDYQTIKFNSDGSLSWVRIYNGMFGDDYPAGIVVDKTGSNVFVTGKSFGNPSIAHYDYLTIKYNTTNGDSLWVKRYNGGGMPGNQNDEAYSMAIDSSSNIYVTGRSIGNNTSWDFVTIKYSLSGSIIWITRYNDSSANANDIPSKIKLDIANNVFVCGSSDAGGIQYDFLTIKYNQPIGITSYNNELPTEFYLSPNYPNPFNPVTKIDFGLPVKSAVKLSVYDILGRELEVLINQEIPAGKYSITWQSYNYSSGIYFYKLKVENYIFTRKMALIK